MNEAQNATRGPEMAVCAICSTDTPLHASARDAAGERYCELCAEIARVKIGPCVCCGAETPYLHNQRDEDGQYYCERCCRIAEAEDAYDCYLGGYYTYETYLHVVEGSGVEPRPRSKFAVGAERG